MWRGTYALTLWCSVRWIILQISYKITFSPCLPSKLFKFFSPQPILPFPFRASHLIFWIVWVQKHKSLVILIQLYLYYCFSSNYHDQPVRSWRVVGQWVQRRQLPLGRLTLLPLALYPGLLLIFCFPLYVALQSWPFVDLSEQLRYLGNCEWADKLPYLPQVVLSSAVSQSSC